MFMKDILKINIYRKIILKLLINIYIKNQLNKVILKNYFSKKLYLTINSENIYKKNSFV